MIAALVLATVLFAGCGEEEEPALARRRRRWPPPPSEVRRPAPKPSTPVPVAKPPEPPPKPVTSVPVVEVPKPPPPPIVPEPKVYKDSGKTAEIAGPDAVAIVVGSTASEPERYAAERFQTLVARRFKRLLPIAVEGKVAEGVRQAILLGQRATNKWVDRLCREKGLDLSEDAPGHDGFIIEIVDNVGGGSPLPAMGATRRESSRDEDIPPTTARDGDVPPTIRQVVLIGGSNPRGVVYGQDAFFDLLRRDGERIVFPVASVRDWPSIAWRGRPISRIAYHYGVPPGEFAAALDTAPEAIELHPDTLDAYVRARLNYIDVRHVRGAGSLPGIPYFANFGSYPGPLPDKPLLKALVVEAHRRGLFVYGTVFCGVPHAEFDAALVTFQEFIDLGVDGLWISFDDPGPGEDAAVLVKRVLELGKSHGITGRRIATTPANGSYQQFDTEFNRQMVQVPGFADATWFFTRVPCPADVAVAKRIGLTRRPSWWHNWPSLSVGGFLHGGEWAGSIRVGDKPPYVEALPLPSGWHQPRYEDVRDAANCVDAVHYWGGGWVEDYVPFVFGTWAWNPERHDWTATRRAAHSYVMGRSQVAAAEAFDDRLPQLRALFLLPFPTIELGYNWPGRLKRLEDRPAAEKLLDEMAARLKELEALAPEATMIPPARLEKWYLEPMRATIATARTMIEWSSLRPELLALEAQVRSLLAEGQTPAAEEVLRGARATLLPRLERVMAALADLIMIKDYLGPMRDRFGGPSQWTAFVAEQQKELAARFGAFAAMDYSKDLATLAAPPEGSPALAELAAGGWLRRPVVYRGLWAAGLVKSADREAALIGHEGPARWCPVEIGEFAEVRAELPVPQFQGRLMLHTFVAPVASGLAAELLANGKVVWQHDMAEPGDKAGWIKADVTALAKDAARLKLQFRVVNTRFEGRFEAVTLLGPVKLTAANQGR